MKTWTIRTLEELALIAQEVLDMPFLGSGARILALSGELGAGKTAFTQALGVHLGIKERMASPTFTLMRSYAAEDPRIKKLIHIDAYRIEKEEEALVLHIPELFNEEGTLVVIEWPERISSLVPESSERISLVTNEDGSRTITYAG